MRYAAEKFSKAMRILKPPHPRGDIDATVYAFFECSLGLSSIDKDVLDQQARNWIKEIEQFMDTDDVKDLAALGDGQLKQVNLQWKREPIS